MAEETVTEEKVELTEEEKAERKKKREARKVKRLAKAKAMEASLAKSKVAHPAVWKGVDTTVTAVQAIPQEEQAETTKLVNVILRNRLRPGKKAKSLEKLAARKERLQKQYAKTLRDLGEEVPEELKKFLDVPAKEVPGKAPPGPAKN